MQWRSRRYRIRRAVLGLILTEMTQGPLSVGLGDFQGEVIVSEHDRAGYAYGAQHESPVLAVPTPKGAIDFDAGVNHRSVRRR
jgi:hypothetical protein